jgi:hypothetical protein
VQIGSLDRYHPTRSRVCTRTVQRGSAHALELAREQSYLPQVGIEFTVEPISVRFGRWRLSWWTLLRTSLPADDETEAVLDFYSDSAEFLL